MAQAKVSPWGFVGMGGMACVLFLDLGTANVAPWWVTLLFLLLWLVLFLVACAGSCRSRPGCRGCRWGRSSSGCRRSSWAPGTSVGAAELAQPTGCDPEHGVVPVAVGRGHHQVAVGQAADRPQPAVLRSAVGVRMPVNVPAESKLMNITRYPLSAATASVFS